MSYAEATRAGLQSKAVQGARKEEDASSMPQKAAATVGHSAEVNPAAQYAAVRPPGPVAAPSMVAAPPGESHDISSDAEYFRWDEYDEPETIGELDPHDTDPKRILNRMRGITRAIQRRSGRLEKAQQDCEVQRHAVEQAKELLCAREQAVKTAESDLHFLQEVHTDLAKKYTALTEEAEQQARQSKQQEQQQCQIQSTQQTIWQAAVTLRGLGVDPRIDSALAALESLFRSAQGGPMQQAVQAAPQPPAAQPAEQPAEQPATQSVATQNESRAVPVPAATPTEPAICTSCWSFACRCNSRNSCNSHNAARGNISGSMEVDQARGAKRSSKEAELSERSSGGQVLPGALLVDSAGNAVAAQGAGAAADLQQPGQGSASDEDGKKHEEPFVELQAETMGVEVGRPSPGSVSAEQPSAERPCEPADCSGVPETYAKSDKAVDQAAKEESKASFANLVKATCSKRSYPY